MLYDILNGMKRINVPENSVKNNLPIGTVLFFSGYGDKRHVIINNKGIDERFSGHGATYETICLEDGSKSQHQALGMEHISQKKDNRIALYFTDKVLNSEELMDLIKKAEQKKAEDIRKKAEQDQKDAEYLETIRKEYSYLETVKESKKRSYALAASNIRKELKRKFPDVKFSVRSSSYSMGNSVDVYWTGLPEAKEVDEIISKYEYGSFDGMTDCYEHRKNLFADTFGSTKYAMTNRRS